MFHPGKEYVHILPTSQKFVEGQDDRIIRNR